MTIKRAYKGQSDYAVPPGDTLLETLKTIRMSQRELSGRMGMALKTINEIIQGKAPITPETAIGLETVLGVEASFWLNLEANFRADLARIKNKEQISSEIETSKNFPYSQMAKNDWLLATKKPEDRVIHLRRFFGVASLSNIDNLPMAANFRRKQTKQTSVYALMAWIRQGEIQAQEVKTGVFSATALREAIPHIRKLTDSSPGFDSILKETCAECGVAVSIVPGIHGTSVQGATRWISKDKALVCLSTRYSWSDIFWFSFFHEVGHILKGHKKKEIFVNFGDPGFIPEDKLLEEEADHFAREALIPTKTFSAFAAKRDFSRPAIEAFAESVGVPPGIVGGRLVKDGLLHWNQVAPYRTKLSISPRCFQDN